MICKVVSMKVYYFEKLGVWQDAKAFCVSIYKITNQFPSEEKFGIVSQIRRASLSISANIAEGISRNTNLDKARFINQAYSSTVEVLNFLIISYELEFLPKEKYIELRLMIETITNKLNALHKALKAK